MTTHIVLLGDSIFDNGSYTDGAPDVIGHLRAILPPVSRATLLAVDGSTTADLAAQCARVPSDATHVVVSIGGNDAILNADLLQRPVSSTAEALELFGARARAFEESYRAAIGAVLKLGLDTTTCTVYDGNLGTREAPLARVALMLFNDAILRVAFEQRRRVIDLRLVVTEPSDYANPIEPSGRGGLKIARAIALCLGLEGSGESPASVHVACGAAGRRGQDRE